MEEYLNREKVLEIVNEFELENRFKSWNDYREIHALFLKVPVADVRPEIYGHWMETDESIGVETAYACSECKYEVPENKLTKFCPDCGAKMLVNPNTMKETGDD